MCTLHDTGGMRHEGLDRYMHGMRMRREHKAGDLERWAPAYKGWSVSVWPHTHNCESMEGAKATETRSLTNSNHVNDVGVCHIRARKLCMTVHKDDCDS